MGNAMFLWIRRVGALFPHLLIAAGAFGQMQELPIVSQVGGHMGPIDIAGPIAVVGQGPRMLVMNVADPANPVTVANLLLKGEIRAVDIQGSLAYLAVDFTGLTIVNISDPLHPQVVSGLALGRLSSNIFVQGSTAYVGARNGDVYIVDVSNRLAPSTLSQFSVLPSGVGVTPVFVNGNLLYVGTYRTGNSLSIFDVSDPRAPALLGSLPPHGDATDIVVAGDFAYRTSVYNADGFDIVDISDPADPSLVGNLPIGAESVALASGHAFVVSQNSLYVVDVSVATSPTIVTTVPVPGPNTGVLVDGPSLFVTGSAGGLRVFDITDPVNPQPLYSGDPQIMPGDLAINGNLVYLTDIATSAMHVLDISDAMNPVAVGPGIVGAGARVVAVRGPVAYLAGNGLAVVDLSDPLAPVTVGTMGTTLSGATGIDSAGAYVYFPTGDNFDFSLNVFDVSVPASPVYLAEIALPAYGTSVKIAEQTLYVGTNGAGVRIFDVADPAQPVEVGVAAAGQGVTAVEVSGTIAYVAASGNLRVFDVSNPASPIEIGFTPLSGESGGAPARLFLQGPRLFFWGDLVTGLSDGLGIFDVSTPSSPTPIAFTNLSYAASIEVERFAYVAAGYNGFYTVAVPPSAPTLNAVPRFINANTIAVSGAVETAGSFVTVGGGVEPRFQQLAAGATAFSIDVELRQEAVSTISVTTMNEFGLVSLPAIRTVVEGVAYPSAVTTVTALALTPSPAPAVALNDTLAFTCTATFSNAAQADVTQFVQWEDIANGEVITPGGLYLNNKVGTAQVRAFVAVFSNVVSVADAP